MLVNSKLNQWLICNQWLFCKRVAKSVNQGIENIQLTFVILDRFRSVIVNQFQTSVVC